MLSVSIISFFVHLLLIYLYKYNLINVGANYELLKNPIAAIYTPFSFILIFEVYLLIYYLPKSITTYISKQYEIITLIIIRRLFKDLSSIELSSDWFQIRDDLQFTYDIVAAILLFYLIYLFHRKNKSSNEPKKEYAALPMNIQRFVYFKKVMAIVLVPILFVLAVYTLSDWAIETFAYHEENSSFKNINNIFFDEFFTILIIADVILLLFSLFLTNQFHKVIRNSGFVISTILIRLSFSVVDLVNTALIICAVIFGLLILLIHNQYEKAAIPREG